MYYAYIIYTFIYVCVCVCVTGAKIEPLKQKGYPVEEIVFRI